MAILFLLQYFFIFHFLQFSCWPSVNTFFCIFETNIQESKDFILHFFSNTNSQPHHSVYKHFVYFWVSFFIFLWLTLLIISGSSAYTTYSLGFLAVILVSSLMSNRLRSYLLGKGKFTHDGKTARWVQATPNPLLLFLQSLYEYFKEKMIIQEFLAFAKLSGEVSRHNTLTRNVHVIVVGESAKKNHMGIYGYHQATTPLLNQLKDDLICFEDVVSAYSTTIKSLKSIFIQTEDAQGGGQLPGMLVDIASRGGFKTAWISNQPASGLNESFATLMGKQCDYYICTNYTEHYSQTSYDENIFQPFKTIIAQQADLCVFIHLLGQHFSFENRFPESFKKQFSIRHPSDDAHIKKIINNYDNATLYNDYVVYSIIDTVKEIDALSSVVYFSDHAIDLFEYNATASQIAEDASKPMFEIPFMVWLSRKYKEENVGIFDTLKQYVNRKIILSDFIHSIPLLWGVEWSGTDIKRNFFANTWEFHPRTVLGNIDFDTEIAALHGTEAWQKKVLSKIPDSQRHKIWCHECNTVEHITAACSDFTGVEVDIFITEENILAWHPTHHECPVALEDLFAACSAFPNMLWWFDVKNLTAKNVHFFIDRLIFLLNKFSINHAKQIVETQEYNLLPTLHIAGFLTSYYLPTKFLRSLKVKQYKTTRTDDDMLQQIRKQYEDSGADYISLDGELIVCLDHFFTDIPHVLTWYEHKLIYDYYRRTEILSDLTQYPQVAIVLVKGH